MQQKRISIGILLVIGLLAAISLSGTTSEVVFPVHLEDGLTGRFLLSVSPEGDGFQIESQDEGGNLTVYVNQLYRIRVTGDSISGRVARFEMESIAEEPFWVNSLALQTEVPRNGMDGIWSPSDLNTQSVVAAEPGAYFYTVADANYGIPYIAAAAASGRNVFAMGLMRQDLSVAIATGPESEDRVAFRLTETTGRQVRALDESFFVSLDPSLNWFQVARQYSDWVDAGTHYKAFPLTKDCFAPVYDTWYWSRDAVNSELYTDVSRVASSIGMRKFLVDSGWDAKTGQYDLGLGGETGNYSPPPEKFPDIVQTFNYLRSAENLGIQLWLQPFAVGRQSTRYAATQDQHIETLADSRNIPGWQGLTQWPLAMPIADGTLENMNLCPRVAGTQSYLRELFTEMATVYHPEGYWLDAMEYLPSMCVAGHTHDYETFGEGFRASLETIRDTILEHNPSAVVQMRGPYANLNTKPYANVWQTPDSPGRPDQMRVLAMKLRPFSNGVVFASDQLYWPASVSEAGAAKAAMTAVLVGVPSYGVDLRTASSSTVRILKTWIDFYRRYQEDLTSGRFNVFGNLREPNHLIDSASRAFVYVRYAAEAPLPVGDKAEVFLFNATDSDRLTIDVQGRPGREYLLTTLDRFHNVQSRTWMPPGDGALIRIDAPVDQGALLILSPSPETEPTPRG